MHAPQPLHALTAGLLLLAACGGGEEAPSSAGEPTAPAALREAQPEITPERGFPAKVRSFTGDVVLVEAPPQRLIAGNASVLDGLSELVGPERVAALPETALRYSLLAAAPGPWSELPRLPSFEAEAILAPRPDLVLVHGYQLGSTVDRVLERGVPLVVLPAVSSWDDTLAGLRTLARLVGEQERGEALVQDLEERRRRLQEPAPRSGRTVLPYGNYGAGGSTAGAGTTWQVMIELAGLRNAATEAGLVGHPGIDFEQVLAIQPDFFLVAAGEGDEPGSAEAVLRGEAALAGLEAVREGRFLRLPEALYSTSSHHVLTAAEQLAAAADALLEAE
jgi:iron complex transport system substrate-binding protein